MKPFCLGIIGYPLAHSYSPRLHQAALQDCGLRGKYELHPLPLSPGWQQALAELFQRMRQGEMDGLNVTIPHKQAVMPFLDELTPSAQAIGAVNTISHLPSGLLGDNTDAPGFLAHLAGLLSGVWERPAAHAPHALLLGAGGSARAVAYGLAQAGWRVSLAARRLDQARQVARLCAQDEAGAIPLEQNALDGFLQHNEPDLLVNTTPLGMWPQVQDCPWPAGLPLPQALVYDLVYNPAQTVLLQRARAAGCKASNGLGMLVEQAALSFERWTGRSPSRLVMRQAITEQAA
ncbi:MAG: shikimate dehydrogenase [Anaerolineales bacterium]|nr:shikimate dehydrogenase [Anaerolineales bacterium]